MATVIMQRSPDGTVRRCTATCHTARNPRCRCICGGLNHGAVNRIFIYLHPAPSDIDDEPEPGQTIYLGKEL